MKSMKDFSTWNSEELSYWLNSINLSRYSNNIIGNNVTGYDLCYLTNDDFKILGISNIHDKNILVKNIRLQTLEQLKLNFKYENKEATVQLDFDSNFSVFELEGFLKEIFQIPSIFHLCTESNEMLCPNIKIIELILLNPQKYKKLKIINGPVSSYQSHKEKESKSRLYDDIPRISYDSDTKRNDQSSLSNIPPTKYKNQRNYDILSKQDNLYEPQSNESNYRTLYYDNNRRGDLDIEDDSMNNSTNIIMNSTPRKYLTDKRINRNSSALMIKPGMALDTNYGRKYNMNYESSNNNSKNESGLNYDYKSQNDYNNNDWIYNNDDKKLNLDPQ